MSASRWLLLGCLLAGCSSSQPTAQAPSATGVEVRLAVDMRKPIRLGAFDPAVDSVGVMGDTAPLAEQAIALEKEPQKAQLVSWLAQMKDPAPSAAN